MPDRVNFLIKILFDATAREDERHDAIMDMSDYNDDRVLNALLLIGSDSNEDDVILDSAGESIAQIWFKRNKFDITAYNKLDPRAKQSMKIYLTNAKPDWNVFIS